MEFIMSTRPDEEISLNIAANGSGETLTLQVQPVCMTFEDYFAGFTADTPPIFSVTPATGRMDRRGGETSELNVRIEPNGRAGDFVGNLVINLPEDNSKICYKINVKSF